MKLPGRPKPLPSKHLQYPCNPFRKLHEAANLANNHSHDYGKKSYTDTISALDDAGIASFGYNRVKIFKVKGIKVGVTGIYELADHQKRASQVKKNIKALKKAGAQIIIVNFRLGN